MRISPVFPLLCTRGGMLQQGFADGSTVNAWNEKTKQHKMNQFKKLSVLSCVLQIFQKNKWEYTSTIQSNLLCI